MNHDQNKKTLRQFQCRDYLWEIFEQMSGELECSVDYLINEAMRQYARSRNYGVRTPGPGGARPPAPGMQGRGAPPPQAPAGNSYPGSYGSGGGYPPPPGPSYGGGGGGGGGYPAPPRPSSYPPPPPTQRPPAYGQPPAQPAYQQPPQPMQQPPMQQPPMQQGGFGAPPPLPGGGMGAPHHGGGGMIPLYVIFNGQKFPVAKDEFIIGRGTKTADLPIKDGNISRRHGAVIWQNGGWYMKDLGSTNGVEFQGRKIDSKRIEEGDIYQLCDYEIRFTYR